MALLVGYDMLYAQQLDLKRAVYWLINDVMVINSDDNSHDNDDNRNDTKRYTNEDGVDD